MKIIYAFIFAVALSTSLTAQVSTEAKDKTERHEKMQDKIESKKIAFITQKLDLTPSEAQKFWPLYNEYQSKMKDFRNQNKLDVTAGDISEEEANNFLDKIFSREQKEIDIKEEYFTKMKSAVSAKKVVTLYVLERKFREEIVANIRSKMGKKKRKMRDKDE